MNSQPSDSSLPPFSESGDLKNKAMICRVWKNSMPELRELIWGDQKTDVLIVGDASLQCYWLSNRV